MEARGNLRIALESGDGDVFHSFCQSVVKDAGGPYGDSFIGPEAWSYCRVPGEGGFL